MRAPPSDVPVVLEDVSVLVGPVALLDGVSLRIAAGAPTVLIGPNGAGKTTLLRVAMGLIAPSRGRVTWAGREHAAPDRRAIVFQRPAMLRRSTAANIGYALAAAAAPRATRTERIGELLALVGLDRPRAPAGAPAVGRRAAAPRTCPRARPRSRFAASRRADGEPRSRRHQGDRGHRAFGRRPRRQGGDVHPRPRPGEANRRRDRAAASRAIDRACGHGGLLCRCRALRKRSGSSPANCWCEHANNNGGFQCLTAAH